MMVQLGMAPQAGVDGVGGWATYCKKVIVVDIDDGSTIGIDNVPGGVRGNESPRGTLKVPSVCGGRHRGVARLGVCGCWLVEFGPRHGASHIDR